MIFLIYLRPRNYMAVVVARLGPAVWIFLRLRSSILCFDWFLCFERLEDFFVVDAVTGRVGQGFCTTEFERRVECAEISNLWVVIKML